MSGAQRKMLGAIATERVAAREAFDKRVINLFANGAELHAGQARDRLHLQRPIVASTLDRFVAEGVLVSEIRKAAAYTADNSETRVFKFYRLAAVAKGQGAE